MFNKNDKFLKNSLNCTRIREHDSHTLRCTSATDEWSTHGPHTITEAIPSSYTNRSISARTYIWADEFTVIQVMWGTNRGMDDARAEGVGKKSNFYKWFVLFNLKFIDFVNEEYSGMRLKKTLFFAFNWIFSSKISSLTEAACVV